MGMYIDTVAGHVTNATTVAETLQAVTLAAGDTLQVRSFTPQGYAKLESIFYQGTVKDQVRVLSPMFHDNVTGITFAPDESPAQFLMPRVVGQPLVSGDTLTLEAGAAAGASSVACLSNYYSDPNGPTQRLHSWSDIAGNYVTIKPLQVAVTSSATIGDWTDTAVNTTDKQLHANTDYAVLGFQTDTALAAIGLKGQATNNLRVCGPGAVSTLDISEYFVTMSDRHGTPHIPVFNSDNQSATYVSVVANTASVSANVYLILAELKNTVTP